MNSLPATVRSPAGYVPLPPALLGRPGRPVGNGFGSLGRPGWFAVSLTLALAAIDLENLGNGEPELRGDLANRDARRALPRYALVAGHAVTVAEGVAGDAGGGASPALSARRRVKAGELCKTLWTSCRADAADSRNASVNGVFAHPGSRLS